MSSNDLDAALRAVWADTDADNWQLLTRYARTLFLRMRFSASDADELAQGVICKLFEKVRGGLALPDVPVAYFNGIAHNFARDELRRRKRRGKTVDRRTDAVEAAERPSNLKAGDFEPERPPVEIVREFEVWYAELVAQATATMKGHAAQRFRATADDVVALKAENVSMHELLAREGVSSDASPDERKRVADRLQQRHKRIRDKLAEVVETAQSTGKIDSETAWEWRQRLFLLRRRQGSQGSDVSESEGHAKAVLPATAEETDHD